MKNELNIKDLYPFLSDEDRKRAKKERIKRGFCREDVVNFSEYMLLYIPRALHFLSEVDSGRTITTPNGPVALKQMVNGLAAQFENINAMRAQDYENCRNQDIQKATQIAFKHLAENYYYLWQQ